MAELKAAREMCQDRDTLPPLFGDNGDPGWQWDPEEAAAAAADMEIDDGDASGSGVNMAMGGGEARLLSERARSTHALSLD